MRIRLAADADLAVLRHLHDERLALLIQGDKRIKPETVQWLDRDSGGVFVGETDSVIGGYLSAWWGDVWMIDHMALDAHAYHPGLARALVAEIRARARENGAAQIDVCVPRRHPVEQAFWRAMGAARADRPASVGYEWMQFRV